MERYRRCILTPEVAGLPSNVVFMINTLIEDAKSDCKKDGMYMGEIKKVFYEPMDNGNTRLAIIFDSWAETISCS